MALGALPLVAALRRRGRCGVLFAQAILPDGLAAVLLGRWTRAPVACLGRGTDVHGLESASRLARALAAFTVRRAAAVGVVAHGLVGHLETLARGRRVTVLPNGIDLARFTPGNRATARAAVGLPPDASVILYVGRLAPRKGLGVLLEAFAQLSYEVPRAVLALVGSGPLEPELAAAAKRLRVATRVHFAGEVAHRDVATWMRAADVLALPSEAEGFPNAVREALACGRPVVATPVGDVPSVVTPAVGSLVPVGDAAALGAALATVLRTQWDSAAIRRSVAGMSWEENAAATWRFLEATVGCA
jgi:glycosyltransferase involved in cell wall biosynthesis